jgi:hypothetical protein
MTNKIGIATEFTKHLFKAQPKLLQFTAAPQDLKKMELRRKITDPTLQPWRKRKIDLEIKGIKNWQPKKKLSREQMHDMKNLFMQDPVNYSFSELASLYGISFEAVRRIIKSRFSR